MAGAVTSPMAGAIKSILVKEGDVVKQGQALVILEAMKMENQITAPVAGTVKSINVAKAIRHRRPRPVGIGVSDVFGSAGRQAAD